MGPAIFLAGGCCDPPAPCCPCAAVPLAVDMDFRFPFPALLLFLDAPLMLLMTLMLSSLGLLTASRPCCDGDVLEVDSLAMMGVTPLDAHGWDECCAACACAAAAVTEAVSIDRPSTLAEMTLPSPHAPMLERASDGVARPAASDASSLGRLERCVG